MSTQASGLLRALREYRTGRIRLLEFLGIGASNRDPLAEFAERLVAALVGGQMAESRVQADWDVLGAEGARIQVRYLANPSGGWVNEHAVEVSRCDQYALVVFEALDPVAVLMFDSRRLQAVGEALGKRHSDLHRQLLLTERNYRRILAEAAQFAELGVQLLPLR